MGSWEHVLEIVTEKAELFTPAKRLCTLDGHIVHAVSELQDGGKYVVLEGTKPFQRVAYCATEDSRALMYVCMSVNKYMHVYIHVQYPQHTYIHTQHT